MQSDRDGSLCQGVPAQIEAGRATVRRLGRNAAAALLRRCVAPAPRGLIALQRHDGIREVYGARWDADMAQVTAWLRAEGRYVQPDKQAQPLICLDNGRVGRKRKADVCERWGLYLDTDRNAPPIAEYARLACYMGWAYAARESYSSTPEAPRMGLLVALAQPIATDEHHVDILRLEQAFCQGIIGELLRADVDPISGTAARAIYCGNRASAAAAARQVVGAEGGGLDHAKVLQSFGYAPPKDGKESERTAQTATRNALYVEALSRIHPYQNEGKRKRRFIDYMVKCQPTHPGILPNGASAVILNLLKVGMFSLLLDREWVINSIYYSEWNAECCAADRVTPWPWSLASLEAKADFVERSTWPSSYGSFCDLVPDASAASEVHHV